MVGRVWVMGMDGREVVGRWWGGGGEMVGRVWVMGMDDGKVLGMVWLKGLGTVQK